MCSASGGVDPNSRGKDDRTPASLAAEKNHLRTLEVLVQGGADIELANTEGRTALHHATTLGNLEIIAFPLAQGERVQKPNIFGTSALHYALGAANDALNHCVVHYTTAFNQWSTAEGTVLNIFCRGNGLKRTFESRRAEEREKQDRP